MARRVFTEQASDFSGGINYMADAFQLKGNEVSDALNVDFDPNGGFRRRDPSQTVNTAIGAIKNLWTFVDSTGTYKQILAQQTDDAAYSIGANFTAINPDAQPCTGTMYAATANDKCYVQRDAQQVVWTWNGAAAAVLVDSHGGYNDNLAAPVGGKMPRARYICRHRNYLFHACINEAGTIRENRLRFSHPFSDLTGTKGVEDYRTNDWIQLPEDGDVITGMVSWGDKLVIFKHRSVWILRGYGPDSFTLENVTMSVGAIGQRAIVVGDEGVYFFSWPYGLQLYDGQRVHDLWYRLTPLTNRTMLGSTIDNIQFDFAKWMNTTVGYVAGRVWVSFTSSGASDNDVTFVYDPKLGKGGAWTRYDLPLGAYTTLAPRDGDTFWYAVCLDSVGEVHQLANHVLGMKDRMGGVDVPVQSWVYTRWFDLGNPALVKRWKHPIFVCDANDNQTLPVSVFRDYTFNNVYRTFDISITAQNTYTWGGTTWGGGLWSPATITGSQSIEKGGLLGRATAVALKIEGPSTGDQLWAVNSITWKYIPRKIRS